jgi:phospholipid N-methyltransferase
VIRFFTQAFKNYRSTGAIAPSSRFLARTIVQSIPERSPKRVLEVGCGTGAFTKEILKTMNDGDAFHIVELNLEFCKTVEATVLEQFRDENPNIEVVMHNGPIEETELEGQFDAIICGLPFNNFQIDLVQHLFTVMFSFLRLDCELAYFEYLGMRRLKRIFGFPSVRKETINRTADIKTRYVTQQGTHVTVWRNLPSCRVVRLRAC